MNLVEMAMLCILNLSDGSFSVLEMAERSGLAFDTANAGAGLLSHHDLLPVQKNGSSMWHPV